MQNKHERVIEIPILLKYRFLSVFFGFPVFHLMQHRLNQFSKNTIFFRFTEKPPHPIIHSIYLFKLNLENVYFDIGNMVYI